VGRDNDGGARTGQGQIWAPPFPPGAFGSPPAAPERYEQAEPAPMSVSFRTATARDIPLLRSLADQIWRACYPEIIPTAQIEYMLGWMYDAGKIAEEIAGGILWEVAEIDAQPIGFLALSFHSATLSELNKLYLLPEYHGRGHGQAVLARALSTAAARGCTELRLRVNKTNARALRSYERAGFRIVESVTNDIGGGFVMDDFILARPTA
jgi:GNAT superfamily N-acetyltransferase